MPPLTMQEEGLTKGRSCKTKTKFGNPGSPFPFLNVP